MNRDRLLLTPRGTQSLYFSEALHHRHMIADLASLYQRWGYVPVETPFIDYHDAYAELLSGQARGETYRMIDRDGEVLMLRSDITLFLAKHLGLNVREDELPLRVWYADSILRHQEAHDLSKDEFFQAGVELLGLSNPEGDAEVIALLTKSLAALGVSRFAVHIGSRSFVNGLYDGRSWDDGPAGLVTALLSRKRRALEACIARDIERGRLSLGRAGKEVARPLAELLLHIGPPEAALPNRSLIGDAGPAARAINRLLDTIRLITALDLPGDIRLDFSEVGTREYHSGIAFRAYLPDGDDAVASGGRYDGLFSRFGLEAASCGFSMLVGKLRTRRAEIAEPIGVDGDSFVERYRKAEELRAQGKAVRL